ncbi:MAG: bifunctional methylenetetrahydrofolate dehydrogenase/methenyltetrahydrofolate cyclohydrolase FolD [Pseudomonadota bacterium]
MPANLISGTQISQSLRLAIAARAARLDSLGCKPGLAVILVGEDPASEVYVRNKVRACAEAGINSVLEKYPTKLTQAALLSRIDILNNDPAIHGILVQMPLPKHIDPHAVIAAISTRKDVDGYSVMSAGELLTGTPGFRPCTPYGCMALIESTGIDLKGKHAVVIGRSNTVGKPMALLLLQANATVTICHSNTPDLGAHTLRADIVVAAVGRRDTLTAHMVKPGAIVIDVGMNRDDDGKLCGDVAFDAVSKIAGWITPVPGGVGPMTITMLLMNTVEAAEREISGIKLVASAAAHIDERL